jgi:transcriptional regulator with XRE-family HTH domain
MDSNMIGNKIKELRNRKGMTQIELANSLNVANTTISNWEKGRRLPSINELKRIASFFNVSLNTFELNHKKVNDDYERNAQVELNQTVDFRPVGFTIKSVDENLMIASIFLICLSNVMGPLMIAILLIGLFLFIWEIVNIVVHALKVKETNFKKILLPVDDDVKYIHESNREHITRVHKKINVIALTLIILNVVLYYVLLFLCAITSTFLIVVISIFALCTIILSFFRYRSFYKNTLIMKEVDYFSVKTDIKNRIVVFGFTFDILTFLSLTLYVSILTQNLIDPFSPIFLILLGFLLMISSFYLFIMFYSFLAKFSLYSIDQNNKRVKLC